MKKSEKKFKGNPCPLWIKEKLEYLGRDWEAEEIFEDESRIGITRRRGITMRILIGKYSYMKLRDINSIDIYWEPYTSELKYISLSSRKVRELENGDYEVYYSEATRISEALIRREDFEDMFLATDLEYDKKIFRDQVWVKLK